MPPEALKRLLRQNPFGSFRLVMTDGKTYDIVHPDFLWIGMAEAHVGTRGDVQEGIWERFDIIALRHITRIEPLPAATPSGSNGAS
jgi:hypothetical protein